MIIALLGKTCSGKTTILKRLQEDGYKAITTYTTRPKREGEVDGVDYHFVTEKEFKLLENNGLIIAPRCFRGWYYGVNAEDIDFSEDYVIVLDPSGLKQLKESVGSSKVLSIYLHVPDNILLSRGMRRGDDTEELLRRLVADERDFSNTEVDIDRFVSELEHEDAYFVVKAFIQIEKYYKES